MEATTTARCSRRAAVRGSAMALTALGLAGVRRAGAQRTAIGSGGVAGGGVARTEEGNEAEFVLFASRLALGEGEEPTVFGRVRWVDPGFESRGVALESVEVTSYGPPAGEDQGSPVRELRGTMTADGEGDYPFLLRVTLAEDEAGLGGDAISLTVGAGAAGTPEAGAAMATPGDGFAYDTEAEVTAGDVVLLDFAEPNRA